MNRESTSFSRQLSADLPNGRPSFRPLAVAQPLSGDLPNGRPLSADLSRGSAPLSGDLWSIILSYSRGNEARYLVENVVPKEKVYEWWDEIITEEELKWVSQFRNLRYLDMWRFTGNDPEGRPIKNVLSPLQGIPLRTLYLDRFTGNDISPLKGMPLQTLYLWSFTGDLSPLQGMKIRNYHGAMI